MLIEPLKIKDLLSDISRNKIKLPEIQRAYVWDSTRVSKLLDSLYKEFPIGQILLWDTDNLPITKNLSGVNEKPLPNAGHPIIVLDGQQRLTSLYLALSKETNKKVDVWFSLADEKFQRYQKKLSSDPRWVSVREVVNGKKTTYKILEEIKQSGICEINEETAEKYLNRIQKLKKIGEYKISVDLFKSDSYDSATELFVRINSQGKRLKMGELALAKLALCLPNMIVDKFEKAITEYKNNGFHLDAGFLIRALISIGTGQSRFRHLTRFWNETSESEISKIWKDTNKAVNSAVNFVKHNAGFDHSKMLPSLNALIILSAYFNKYPKIAENVESGLLKWFYLASLRGKYSGSSETSMDEDLKAISSDDPLEGLMKNLKDMGCSLEVKPDEFDDIGLKNPLFSMTYAMIRRNHAKDWFKGVELTRDAIGKDNDIQIHHIFPKKVLREHGVSRKDRDEIANLAFLSAKPNQSISANYPEEYLSDIANSHPERLKSQCIPMDKNLWKVENFQKFLEARREMLAEAVNKLLAA